MSDREEELFRALVNCLDFLRTSRGGHIHSADGDVSCIGCCIVAEGEHAINTRGVMAEATDKQREEFEKYYRAHGESLRRDPDGKYKFVAVAWCYWNEVWPIASRCAREDALEEAIRVAQRTVTHKVVDAIRALKQQDGGKS